MSLSRRQLARGAAWTVPIIGVAAAAPSASASAAYDARVEGSCLSDGLSIFTWARFYAKTATPVPAGRMIRISETFPAPRDTGNIVANAIITSVNGGQAGIGEIEVAADRFSATLVTTRDITLTSWLDVYLYRTFEEVGSTVSYQVIDLADANPADNLSTVERTELFDPVHPLCWVR